MPLEAPTLLLLRSLSDSPLVKVMRCMVMHKWPLGLIFCRSLNAMRCVLRSHVWATGGLSELLKRAVARDIRAIVVDAEERRQERMRVGPVEIERATVVSMHAACEPVPCSPLATWLRACVRARHDVPCGLRVCVRHDVHCDG
jgi:hypothetical protein